MKQPQVFKRIQDNLKDIPPFSWQTLLLLSLFSWFVYLLIRDPDARRFVSLFGWLFVIMGVDWALFDEPVKVPWLQFKFLPAPWVTGAVVTAAFLSNQVLIADWRTALISYPLIAAAIGTIHQFLKAGPKFKTWKEIDKGGRQYLVLLILLGVLFSAWFQFHFALQDVLRDYPSVLAERGLDRSGFVVRINPTIPVSRGVVLLDTAESILREQLRVSELRGLSWIDGQRFVANVQSEASPLNPPRVGALAIARVFGDPLLIEEGRFWQYDSVFSPLAVESPQGLRAFWFGTLTLRAFWRGPSALPDGYVLEKVCWIPREPPIERVVGLQRPRDLGQTLFQCQPITSQPPDVVQVQAPAQPNPNEFQNQPQDPNQPQGQPPQTGGGLFDRLRTAPWLPEWLRQALP